MHRSRMRFEVAEHRGAFWKEYSRFMRMAPFYSMLIGMLDMKGRTAVNDLSCKAKETKQRSGLACYLWPPL
jgi:hypothetical protein